MFRVPDRNRTHDLPNTRGALYLSYEKEVMGSIPVGDSGFFLVPRSFHVGQFTFHIHYRAQSSPSLLTYHYSKSVVVVVTTLLINKW